MSTVLIYTILRYQDHHKTYKKQNNSWIYFFILLREMQFLTDLQNYWFRRDRKKNSFTTWQNYFSTWEKRNTLKVRSNISHLPLKEICKEMNHHVKGSGFWYHLNCSTYRKWDFAKYTFFSISMMKALSTKWLLRRNCICGNIFHRSVFMN